MVGADVHEELRMWREKVLAQTWGLRVWWRGEMLCLGNGNGEAGAYVCDRRDIVGGRVFRRWES